MITYRIVQQGDVSEVHIAGDLSGGDDATLSKLASEVHGRSARFHLGQLGQINSHGVCEWVVFVRKVAVPVTFVDCAVGFVYYVNLVPAVRGAGAIESFHAPLTCTPCRVSETVVLDAKRLPPSGDFGTRLCPKCGHAMEPEVDPADYLRFLTAP